MKEISFEKIVSAIGVLAFLGVLVYAYKLIIRKTNTNIISEKAKSVIADKEQALRLRRAVDTYHITGDWSKTEINEIL